MGYTKMTSVITAVSCICHYGWCHLFVYEYDMHIEGIALATLITYGTNFFGSIVYVYVYMYLFNDEVLKESWFFPDSNTTKDLWEFTKLAVNCALLMVI